MFRTISYGFSTEKERQNVQWQLAILVWTKEKKKRVQIKAFKSIQVTRNHVTLA